MIIITGASKNVGRYLFTAFKGAGYEVAGTYNSSLEGFEEDAADYRRVDISDYRAVQEWIASLGEHLRDIVLINCAGISYNSFAHKADMDKWRRVVEVNLLGTFNVIHEVLPLMRTQRYGRIINISSVVAKFPTPGVSAYAATKSALWGLSRSLAAENGSMGITVNSINLGYVNAGMGVNDVPEAYQEKIKALIPSGRFCEPEEIFRTVRYLMDTPYVNGSEIDINGGLV